MKPLEIGFVERAHGLRGELRVRLHFPDSDALSEAREVILRRDERRDRLAVLAARKTPGAYLVLLEGVADRTAAESYRGASVEVEREELPELESDEYYLSDLVGARVVDAEGEVGVVIELAMYPTVDAIVVRRADGTIAEQPLVDEWVQEVDVQGQRIVLKGREGLIG